MSLCNECESKATEKCEKCDLNYCMTCSKIIHSLKKRKDHKTTKITNNTIITKNPEITTGLCTKHEKQKIIAFCKTCEETICLHCTFGEHDGHKRTTLLEIKEDGESKFQNNFNETILIEENFSMFKKKFVEVKIKSKKKEKERKIKEIKDYYSILRESINNKEKEVINLQESLFFENG
jgi:hypothetical protein